MFIFDWIAKAVLFLASLALAALVLLMGYQVWGRYVLNDTPTWAESLALLLILLVVLPVSAVGLRENFHLGITYFIDLMHSKVQSAIEFATILVIGAFGAMMTFHSMELVTKTWARKMPLIGFPQGTRYLPLVVCGGLIVLFMVEKAIKFFQQRSSKVD